jgi:isopenicillin-N epimerase
LSDLVDEGARVVAKALGTGVGEVAHPAATMRLVELPRSVELTDAEAFKTRVSRELKAEITLTGFDERVFIRLSAHAYNSLQDYEELSERLPEVLT